jgi:hypothetical protein
VREMSRLPKHKAFVASTLADVIQRADELAEFVSLYWLDKRQPHSSTYLGQAVTTINQKETYDRLIVLTDEQSHDAVPNAKAKGYLINVAADKNGIGYGAWTHFDGFSEAIFDYIGENEK